MMGNRPQLSYEWKLPEQPEDLDVVFEAGTHVIYKHSYNCAVCIFSKTKVEELMQKYGKGTNFYFIDVVKLRQVALEVANRTGVRHESPQVIVLKDGNVYWHASHSGINKDELRNAIEQ